MVVELCQRAYITVSIQYSDRKGLGKVRTVCNRTARTKVPWLHIVMAAARLVGSLG